MEALTAQYLRSVLDYDPKTGLFFWRLRDGQKRWNARFAGQPAGSITEAGYVKIRLGKERPGQYAHRLAWLYVHGVWPPEEVDHRDRDRSNNRIDNLRLAGRSENMRNAAAARRSATRTRGIWFDKKHGKWEACIYVNRARVWWGWFNTADEAATARLCELDKHHGEFANYGDR